MEKKRMKENQHKTNFSISMQKKEVLQEVSHRKTKKTFLFRRNSMENKIQVVMTFSSDVFGKSFE